MKRKPDKQGSCRRCGNVGPLWYVRFRYGVLYSVWSGPMYGCEECCTSRPGRWKYANIGTNLVAAQVATPELTKALPKLLGSPKD